jgi:protein-S-isoprenylcysteine O-methyltransferase Ste14
MNNFDATARDDSLNSAHGLWRSFKRYFVAAWCRELRGKKLRIWGSWCAIPIYISIVHQAPGLIGVLALLSGTALRMWASGFLRKESTLCTTGPYALSRNPLYVGSLVVAVAMPLGQNSITLSVIVAAVFFSLFKAIIAKEEEVLAAKFGAAYRIYCQRVPAFISINSIQNIPRALRAHSFSVRTWITNRGWEPAIVALAIYFSTILVAFLRT